MDTIKLQNSKENQTQQLSIEQASKTLQNHYNTLISQATQITNDWWVEKQSGELNVDYRLAGMVRYPIFEPVMINSNDNLVINPYWDAWGSGKVLGRPTFEKETEASISIIIPGLGNRPSTGYLLTADSKVMVMGHDRVAPSSGPQGCFAARFYLNREKLTELQKVDSDLAAVLDTIQDAIDSDSE